MRTRKYIVCVAAILGLALLTGCPVADTRTADQGGSNIVQATGKIASNNLAALNPDDIQVLTDLAASRAGVNLPPVTNEQAAAVVTFFKDNNIKTIQDLEAKMADPDSLVISDEVRAVIESINPADYEGVNNSM